MTNSELDPLNLSPDQGASEANEDFALPNLSPSSEAALSQTRSESNPDGLTAEQSFAPPSAAQLLLATEVPNDSNSEMTNTSSSEESVSEPAKRKRQIKMFAWGSAAVVFVAAVIAGGVAIYNGVEEAKAERISVVESYEASFNSYEVVAEDYVSAVSQLEGTRKDTDVANVSATDGEGKTFLSTWDESFASASSLSSETTHREKLPTSATNEELKAEEIKLDGFSSQISSENETVGALSTSLDSELDARKEAVRAAKAAAEVKAKKDAAQPVAFTDLFRAGDTVKGTYYQFTGKIIQDAGEGQYRVSITSDPGYSRTFWKDPIYVLILGDAAQPLLEDDIISFTASSLGVMTYESIFKQSIKIPSVLAAAADVAVVGRDE